MIPAALALALLSCTGATPAPALPPACQAAPVAGRDACVLAWLADSDDAPSAGDAMLPWCHAMKDQDLRDQCLDLAVSATPPAADATCAEIGTPRIRESCALAVADRRRTGHRTLAPMLDDCATTDATLAFCLSHVVEHRTSWWSQQPAATVVAEVRTMLERFPRAATSVTLTTSLQIAMNRPGFPEASRREVCAVLPEPNATACLAPPSARSRCTGPADGASAGAGCLPEQRRAGTMGPPLQDGQPPPP